MSFTMAYFYKVYYDGTLVQHGFLASCYWNKLGQLKVSPVLYSPWNNTAGNFNHLDCDNVT
jgi:hypothetical protein